MKQNNKQKDFQRTSLDMSHRTFREIKNGPPKPKPIKQYHASNVRLFPLSGFELQQAIQQAAKYLPKNP